MNNNYSIIRISSNFHQIVLVATDGFNNVIAWSSAVFGCKKASEESYNMSKLLADKLKELDIDNVDVVVKGYGIGKEPAIKALMDNGITVNMIKDKTPVPHNGVVPLKRSRQKH